ncbi:heavy metal translocating P-type ATPase [Sediminibacillus albus]|uniref:Cd(2+)-exporting ATPase n=1 Tax=Sediminibacillus albus TaxID=407036 RepID=A0A1G9AJ62_9BACI|nr:heavy metal translocating P-type ATPase [Sediminibacillus albus]SDK27283.1 Cd2+/Zn2+-exporting ATPase [Sediminibacillus albus]
MENNSNVYRLQGLSCTNCAAKFEKNIRSIESVEDVELNFGASKMKVIGKASISQLEQAGAFDGIKVLPERQRQTESKESMWSKRENLQTTIALLLVFAGYGFYFSAGENSPVTIGVFLSSILIGGYGLFKEGLKNLAKLHFDMKTLMTIAVIGAAIIGEWAEAAVVVFLFALSEALEGYSMDKARQSIRILMGIAPNRATIKRENELLEMDVEDVRIDDTLIVKPGQKIAMDGEVILGQSSINQAEITGESIPVLKSSGDEVFAGTLNQEGYLEVRVTKLAEDTTIAQVIHLVEEAQAERAPSQQFVDKFAKYYTPAILLISLLVAVIPPLFYDASLGSSVYNGLAVLVVGCPCALVISTPVAIVTAIGNAARKGVLIKGGIHLEETGRLKVIAFDKTGTLTKGKPEVTDILSFSNLDEQAILSISAALETHSQHPLAAAILRKAGKEDTAGYKVEDFQSMTGQGAQAIVGNTLFYIGKPSLFTGMFSIPDNIQTKIDDLQLQGKTVSLLGTNQEIKGLIAAADQVRKGSLSIIEKLYELGITKTVMLTGDNQFTGRAIGSELGLSEVQADLMPEDKLQVIKKLRESYGKTAMIGDGVNDAPALASANVGIAMGGAGTDTALETADIAFMADDLDKLPYTIALSRKTLAVIKQNVAFALGLKLLALLLLIPGWLTLWLAIFADMGATLIVVLNSLRLIKAKYSD